MRLSRSIVGQAEADAVAEVLCQDGYLGMGNFTRQFEQDLASYLGVAPWQVISANSGTASLHLAVWAAVARARSAGTLPSKPRILAPSLTFVSSFQAIVAGGCEPVACDVLLNTGTLDLADAERRMSEDVIAIMHVDYASNPWHLEKIYEFGRRRHLAVIDDAAHAFGCRYHGQKIGSFGDLVCFSFDGIKNITCGEGGCIVVFDQQAASVCQDARLVGVCGDTQKRYAGARSWEPDVIGPGLRYHLSNIMAAIGIAQLKRLENEFIPARRRLYEYYRDKLHGVRDLLFLETDPKDYIVPHILPVRILNNRRSEVKTALEAEEIQTGMHYRPNHLLSFFGAAAESLPNSEQLHHELLSLPLHPGLNLRDVDEVCAIVRKVLD